MHVVDVTHPNAQAHAKAVYETLKEIGADHIPVLTALNKIDRLSDPERAVAVQALSGSEYPNSVAISALTGDGLGDLLESVRKKLFETYAPICVRLPYQEGSLISLFHEHGVVDRIQHGQKGVLIEGRVPARLLGVFRPYQNGKKSGPRP